VSAAQRVKQFVYAELKVGTQIHSLTRELPDVDLRREVKPMIAAMRARNVEVGRLFPALPNFMRVTIGTRPQMDAFVPRFRAVMS